MPSATTSAVNSLSGLVPVIQTAEGFPELLSALHAGRSGTIDGAWGSSAALATATLMLQAPHTLLVVIAHPRDLDAWAADLFSLAGLRPVLFPAWDNLPTDRAAVDETAGQRLRALERLQAVASVGVTSVPPCRMSATPS